MTAVADRGPSGVDAPAVPARPRRRNGRGIVAAVVLVLLACGALLHIRLLGELRRVEAAYVAGRQVTACTIARLDPSAGESELARLDETLDVLVAGAATRSAVVRDGFRSVDVSPLPQAETARSEVRAALEAQAAAYAAMASGADGDAEVRALGRRNRAAETALARFRTALGVQPGRGWGDRLNCARGGAGR